MLAGTNAIFLMLCGTNAMFLMLCSVASALRLIDRPRLASPPKRRHAVTRRAALLSALASVHSARAADSEATEEMVASSTERWSRFFVDTVPRGPAASAPDVVLAATRACYRECFSKFGDSLLPPRTSPRTPSDAAT